MVCCQSEKKTVEELQETEKDHKCWYANISDGKNFGIGRSHTDDHLEYNGKVIHLNESTTFNYHCYRSDLYSENQMVKNIESLYN